MDFFVDGDILRAGRLLAGLSQEDIAKRVDISRQTLAKIEHMDADVALSYFQKVREVLEAEGIEFVEPSVLGSAGIRWARKDRSKKRA
jgi:transcriptional regulator with XRE-family HTH domain